jgi:hypothetical protein
MRILDIIESHRDEILKAEIGALLHDLGKLSSDFMGGNFKLHEVIGGSISSLTFCNTWPERLKRRHSRANTLGAQNYFPQKFKSLLQQSTIFSEPFNDRKYSWGDFIDFHTPALYSRNDIITLLGTPAKLTRLLAICDGFDSGSDKGDLAGQGQQQTPIYGANAFGFESILGPDLDRIRQHLVDMLTVEINQLPGNRTEILKDIQKAYVQGLGETRRAANDVSLWDHSYSVASLYKSALAQIFIEKAQADSEGRAYDFPKPSSLRWRILRINVDVLGYYAKAHKIADVFAYKEVINKIFEKLKDLLEVQYPFGNEVYRDTTGIYFTFPNIEPPDDLKSLLYETLVKVDPEIVPLIATSKPDPKYSHENEPAKEELKTLLGLQIEEARKELNLPIRRENLYDWQKKWNDTYSRFPNLKWEICPVCYLRPKKEKDETCDHCCQRRESRITIWKEDPSQTIWIDEVADHNDRVALLVGRFDLTHWLNGQLVESMLVNAQSNISKNPSPARLRRIWDTCLNFWNSNVLGIIKEHSYGKIKDIRTKRVVIIPKGPLPFLSEKIYDGEIEGNPIALFWLRDEHCFITAINLELVIEDGNTKNLRGKKVSVEDDGNKIFFPISETLEISTWSPYLPYISLVESPDQFMALVPARDALELANRIRSEFQNQFSKVRNRLSLHLGLVFFHRKTPLYAVLDTGKRMSQSKLKWEEWTIEEDVADGKIKFSNGFCWKIEDKLGDGSNDNYYPYFYIKDPSLSNYTFQHKPPESNTQLPMVSINDLKKDYVAILAPSHFSYMFLDTTTKRFEAGREEFLLYLENIEGLLELWNSFRKLHDDKRLSDTKLRAMWSLLARKKEEWGEKSDVYKKFVRDVLKVDFGLEGKDLDKMEEAIFSGLIFKCLELNLKIFKERLG